MMSFTQGNTLTKKANQTYNANDKNKVKHIETNRVNDQVYTEQAIHRQKIFLIRLILQGQAHIYMDNGNEIKFEVQGDKV